MVNIDEWLVGNFKQDPIWEIRKEFLLESLKRPPAGTIRRIFGGKLVS